jgi:hypothetical protein
MDNGMPSVANVQDGSQTGTHEITRDFLQLPVKLR